MIELKLGCENSRGGWQIDVPQLFLSNHYDSKGCLLPKDLGGGL